MWPTGSDAVLAAAAGIALAFAAATLLVGCAVAWERARNRRRRETRARLERKWRPLLAACIDPDGPLDLATPPADEYLVLLSVWADYHELLSGEGADDLNAAAEALGIPRFAVALLRSRSPRRRAIGLITLGHLADRAHLAQVLPALADPSARVSLAAARAVVQIDPAAGLPEVLAWAGRREDWPTARLGQLLRDVPRDLACRVLREATADARGEHVLDLLKLSRALGCTTDWPAIEAIMEHHPTAEVLVECLRLLDDPRGLARVRAAAGHAAWPVRAQAAAALGRIGEREDVDRLRALLGDREWWVRLRAADALVALPFMSPAALADLARTLEDRYAHDMLVQVLADAVPG